MQPILIQNPVLTPISSMSSNKKTKFKWKTRYYAMRNGLLYYLHMIIDRATKVKQVSMLN